MVFISFLFLLKQKLFLVFILFAIVCHIYDKNTILILGNTVKIETNL